VRPDSGWVSFRIRTEDDVGAAIELFRMAYDRATAASSRTTNV
jgi:hypothetical protein